jgi:hypothetical protein
VSIRWLALAIGGGVSAFVLGCGEGDTTTIIQQAPTTTQAEAQTPPPEPGLNVDSQISTQGLGPVLAGMTQREVEQAARAQLSFPSGMDPLCSYATTPAIADVSFMFVRRELARVDVRDPRITTLSGIHVGSTEKEVLSTYGAQIQRERNEYVPKGSYLMYVPKASTDPTRIVFETDGTKVTYIRAGRLPEVEYIEGCS